MQGQRHGAECKQQQRPEEVPGFGKAEVLEEDPLEDQDEVGERVDMGKPLEDERHILDGGYITGEDDGRHHETEYGEKGLLLGG